LKENIVLEKAYKQYPISNWQYAVNQKDISAPRQTQPETCQVSAKPIDIESLSESIRKTGKISVPNE
jgi:hypothetical protein